MSVVLFYFSGTGNTRYIARQICATLQSKEVKAQAVSIEGLSVGDARTMVDNSSVVGLGWPIYGSDMPKIMKSFIRSLPISEKKPLLTFCTQMAFSGDGAVIMRRYLEAKGYLLKWSMQFNMPNNISAYGIPFSSTEDYSDHETKYLKKARKKAGFLAYKVYKNVSDIRSATVFHTIAAMSQRPAFKYLFHSPMQKSLGISDDCDGCGACVKMCPRGVLKMEADRAKHIDQRQCTLCFRCVDFCPKSAVTVAKKVKLPHYKGPDKETYIAIMTDGKA